MKRRKFIQLTAISSATLASLPGLVSCSTKAIQGNYGLGIYTLRDALNKDFEETLKRIALIGYKDLEFWNYSEGKIFDVPAGELKVLLDEIGLTTSSLHIGIDPLSNDLQQAMDTANKLDMKYIVCNYLLEDERKSLDDYKAHAELFNKCGEEASKNGLQFAYHNHDFEFIDFDGTKPYNLLLDECDNDLVQFEMDMYWMTYAQEKPADYFERFPGRFPLWHVKDMNAEQNFTPVGAGIIDWKELFTNADKAGLKQYFVEQDQSSAPFEDIEKSLEYLKKNDLKVE